MHFTGSPWDRQDINMKPDITLSIYQRHFCINKRLQAFTLKEKTMNHVIPLFSVGKQIRMEKDWVGLY